MSTKLKNVFVLGGAALFMIVSFISCQKGETSKQSSGQSLSVFLTDGPGPFDKVLVQVNAVEVKLDTSSAHMNDDNYGDRMGQMDDDRDDDHKGFDQFGQWDTLAITPGSYDLLKLRNGIDTLLASGNITGHIRKIRITIGSVTVVKDSVSYPVTLMPGVNNYLYIHVHNEHLQRSGDNNKVWIDFDVARSIIEINGKYYLRPVLKPFCDNNYGRIEGIVLPAAAGAVVKVYNTSDTASAIPEPDGRFRVRGLTEGSYSVLFHGSNGYQDTTLTNVSVKKGEETMLAPVTLRK